MICKSKFIYKLRYKRFFNTCKYAGVNFSTNLGLNCDLIEWSRYLFIKTIQCVALARNAFNETQSCLEISFHYNNWQWKLMICESKCCSLNGAVIVILHWQNLITVNCFLVRLSHCDSPCLVFGWLLTWLEIEDIFHIVHQADTSIKSHLFK